MKPDTFHASSAGTPLIPLVPFATAKIVRHPRSKKTKETPELMPPDEETLLRLNAMAKQYPFCISHRGKYFPLL